ncbi:hypothetical protein LOTGIDRAFT_163245 [Lottia gigantea]|uniref:CCHC-type domain-containing protein n=1 Tax=Lottia gigantea TaxID=225164 RepID=V3ZKM8_LOTGI|nr:hypothetical protein LOTGIDRAFT_163245 [Lottia gigantea]ESO91883.1 hypothetical protein LOTGIDRAFT_163245 [Lottia gigantea]
MAMESEICTLFQNLTGELVGLSTTLKHHGVSSLVERFSGDPKNYSDWMKSIEKYALLADIPDAKIKYIAYQSSSGTVSDFLARFLPENPYSSWTEVKRELATRFDTITDAQHALVVLQTARQKSEENVQIFAERLLTLATKAYSSTEIDLVPVQRQPITVFLNGLTKDYLKLKLMRENPATLQGAVVSAMGEQNIRSRFALRSDAFPVDNAYSHEPMEVDHVRPQRRCSNCNRFGHRTNDCRSNQRPSGHVNAFSKNDRNNSPPERSYQPNNRNSSFSHPNRSIVCWTCNNTGHISRNCSFKPPSRQQFSRPTFNQRRHSHYPNQYPNQHLN